MKILHAGNMANLGYLAARELRKSGLDVDLLLEKNSPKGSDPKRFDPLLNENYPEWILFFDKKKSSWKYDIIKVMRNKKYDLIHAYVELPIFAYVSRRPFIAHSQGSDFRELAFSNSVKGMLLRKAYKKAKIVLFSQPDQLPLFSKLKLVNYLFIPILWDTSFYKPMQIVSSVYSDKFVIFHPSNLEWRLKGNDIFLRGFADFVKENPSSVLVIVDRGIDSEKTHELINHLDIKDKVVFIPGPLNSSELLCYYNICDVVADQFKLGSIGSIGLETFCCGKPLISFINEELHKYVYEEMPPICNARDSSEVKQQLEYLKHNEIRSRIGKQGYNWVIKYHSPKIFSQKINCIYKSVLAEEKIEEIREKILKINRDGNYKSNFNTNDIL